MALTQADVEQEIRGTYAAMPGPLPTAGAVTGDEFRDFNNNPEGIRAPHAIDALEAAATAGSFERYDLGGGAWVALALASVTIGKPYTMLIQVVARPNAPPQIAGAWRLYDLGEDVTPTTAFAEFVAANALEITLGSEGGVFFGQRVLGASENGIGYSGPKGTEFRASAMVMRRSSGESEWSWVFAIDPKPYFAVVQSRR